MNKMLIYRYVWAKFEGQPWSNSSSAGVVDTRGTVAPGLTLL